MTLQPLWSAPLTIQIHAFAAMSAFVIGGLQLLLPKGTPLHRSIGWVWVVTLCLVAVSSFGISTIRQFGPFSWIHLLSIFVLVMLPWGVLAARSGKISLHRSIMRGTFIGALVVAGFFTLAPGRIRHAVIFGH